jgi:hypothetical protein
VREYDLRMKIHIRSVKERATKTETETETETKTERKRKIMKEKEVEKDIIKKRLIRIYILIKRLKEIKRQRD